MKKQLAFLLLCAAAWSAAAGPIDYLPYQDAFESYTNGAALVDGTNGWYSNLGWPPSYSVAKVQNAVWYQGARAAMIPELAVILSNRFENIAANTIWTRLCMAPMFYDGEEVPEVDPASAGVFYFGSNGYFMVHDGPAAPSTNWLEVATDADGAPAPVLAEGAWANVYVYQNFELKEWALFVSNTLLKANIGFVNDGVASFSGFDVCNGAGTSYLDNVSVSTAMPPDVGTAWMPELWVATNALVQTEFAGRAAPGQNFLLRRASGSLPMAFTNVVTMSGSGSWLSAAPFSGVNTGEDQQVDVAYDSAALPAGQYNGQIQVVCENSFFRMSAANSPQDIAATLHLMEMQFAPSVLAFSNSVGKAATPRTFTVVNGGSGNMLFTLSENATWLSLNTHAGASLGPADVNVVTAYFAAVSLLPGIYTTNIVLASGTASGWTSTVAVALTVCEQARLVRTPSQITRRISKGESLAPTNFLLWNASSAPRAPMNYLLSCDAPWLALNPTSGTSTGEVETIQLFFDVAGLNVGSHIGRITIAATDAVREDAALNSPDYVEVVVNVVLPAPPTSVTASDGSYSNMIQVSWTASADAAGYEVWRSASSNFSQASFLGAAPGTAYNDVTVPPGVSFWYWVKSVNAFGAVGLPSASDAGWRGLAPPSGVRASAGLYDDKVAVAWNASAGAGAYEVWRSANSDNPGAAVKVADVVSLGYDDTNCAPETVYYYRVKAKCALGTSLFSASAPGWIHVSGLPDAPAWVDASDGVYSNKVRVAWPVSSLASRYEVWRSEQSSVDTAVLRAQTTATVYDDADVTPGCSYYFWVRAGNTNGLSPFGPADSGYAAKPPGPAGNADIALENVVALMRMLPAASSPGFVSMRLLNHGPEPLAGGNTEVFMDFYISRNSSFAAPGRVWIGNCSVELNMASGAETLLRLPDTALTNISIPWFATGEYYLFASVRHGQSSGLFDPDLSNNTALRAGTIEIASAAPGRYHVPNDFAGVKRSDLAVYHASSGGWYVYTVDGAVLVWAVPWGGPGLEPVQGDYDGDGRADLAVYGYAGGDWYVATLDGVPLLWAVPWGGSLFEPVAGDFFGSGIFDMAVYTALSGRWFVRSVDGSRIAWDIEWGGAGMGPVSGDFMGNGVADLAVYTSRGDWYVRPLEETKVIAWAKNWGAAGMTPVAGDYDGDGMADLAVYHAGSGAWYIRTVDGGLIAWAAAWGGRGFTPVPGDYDGDGIYDMAVYEEASGKWYVLSLSRGVLLWGVAWGGPGLRPVGAAE